MTASGIDLKIVGDRLGIVEAAIGELRALPATDLATFTSDRRNIWASDALLRRAIEALFDTARHLLAKAPEPLGQPVFWKHGALALAVAFLATGLAQTALWTLDLSR